MNLPAFESATPAAQSALSTRAVNRKTVWATVGLTLLISALLELWRPYFYLTDDNLSGFLPTATEFGRKLWSGQWPFVSDGIFGGDFDLLADPGVFGLLGPWGLAFSWVSLTPFWTALVDIVSVCNSLTIAVSFCWAAAWLRDHLRLSTPDWLIVALSVSYTFTPYNLLVGSSWVGFLNGQASLPLIFVGFFHPSFKRAVALQSAALLYALFGGHAHVFVMVCLFAGVISLVLSAGWGTMRPIVRLMCAAGIAAICMVPVLWHAMTGFSGSTRAAGLTIAEASARRMEAPQLLIVYAVGPIATLISVVLNRYTEPVALTLSSAYSATNLLFLMIAIVGIRGRRLSTEAWAALGCFTLAALMVARPHWLGVIVSMLPLLKSLQWPFREIWVLHFAAHFFVLLMASYISEREARVFLSVGLLATLGIAGSNPPTFYEFSVDRRLVLSNAASEYWDSLTRTQQKRPRIIVGVDSADLRVARSRIPFSLIGGYNFGSLFHFTSESGYTYRTALRDEGDAAIRPYFFSGTYTVQDARNLARQRPGVWLILLTNLDPVEWTVETPETVRRFRLLARGDEIVELTPSRLLEKSSRNARSAMKAVASDRFTPRTELRP